MRQHTIRKAVGIEGVGLHSGKVARVTLSPAPADAGIAFRVRSTGERIPARAESVVNAHYATTVDRKSTRLNSSHVRISYAVFCLKKKRPAAERRAFGEAAASPSPRANP